mgnify:CR=1 FL=1
MIYNFICPVCHKHTDIEIPMGNDLPKDKVCEFCHTGILYHNFSDKVKSLTIDIPQHMMATSRYAPRMKYPKDALSEKLMNEPL